MHKSLFLGLGIVFGFAALAPQARADRGDNCMGPRAEAMVNRSYRDNDRIDVLEYLNLDSPACRGRVLQSVQMVASTNAGQGDAHLGINGNVVSRAQNVSRSLQTVTFPANGYALGAIRASHIVFHGNFFVRSITINFMPMGPVGPGPGDHGHDGHDGHDGRDGRDGHDGHGGWGGHR
jgi:hypothetical protein